MYTKKVYKRPSNSKDHISSANSIGVKSQGQPSQLTNVTQKDIFYSFYGRPQKNKNNYGDEFSQYNSDIKMARHQPSGSVTSLSKPPISQIAKVSSVAPKYSSQINSNQNNQDGYLQSINEYGDNLVPPFRQTNEPELTLRQRQDSLRIMEETKNAHNQMVLQLVPREYIPSQASGKEDSTMIVRTQRQPLGDYSLQVKKQPSNQSSLIQNEKNYFGNHNQSTSTQKANAIQNQEVIDFHKSSSISQGFVDQSKISEAARNQSYYNSSRPASAYGEKLVQSNQIQNRDQPGGDFFNNILNAVKSGSNLFARESIQETNPALATRSDAAANQTGKVFGFDFEIIKNQISDVFGLGTRKASSNINETMITNNSHIIENINQASQESELNQTGNIHIKTILLDIEESKNAYPKPTNKLSIPLGKKQIQPSQSQQQTSYMRVTNQPNLPLQAVSPNKDLAILQPSSSSEESGAQAKAVLIEVQKLLRIMKAKQPMSNYQLNFYIHNIILINKKFQQQLKEQIQQIETISQKLVKKDLSENIYLYFQQLYKITNGKDRTYDQQLLKVIDLLKQDHQRGFAQNLKNLSQSPIQKRVNNLFDRRSKELSTPNQSQQKTRPAKQRQTLGNNMPLSNLRKGISPPRKDRKDSGSSGNTDFECEPSITDDKEYYLNGEERKVDLNNSDYMRGSVGSAHHSRQHSIELNLQTPQGKTGYPPMDTLTRQTEIEKKIEENLRKAQGKLEKEMRERKLNLEKEQILYFQDLCKEIQKEPEFADKSHLLKSIQLPILFEKCKLILCGERREITLLYQKFIYMSLVVHFIFLTFTTENKEDSQRVIQRVHCERVQEVHLICLYSKREKQESSCRYQSSADRAQREKHIFQQEEQQEVGLIILFSAKQLRLCQEMIGRGETSSKRGSFNVPEDAQLST